MRLGVDLLFLTPGESGGRETYVRELLRALAAGHPEVRPTAFVNRDTDPETVRDWHPGAEVVKVGASPRSRVQWALAESVLLPRAAARAGIEVLHSPANFAPARGAFARVLTLHDLLYRRHPELIPPLSQLATGPLVARGARGADRVITVSDTSKREIVAELGIPAERVEAIPNGAAPPPSPPPDPAAERARLGLGERRVALSVASHLPHKRLPTLVEAVAELQPDDRPVLVLAGGGTDGGDLARLADERGVGSDVRCLGAVSPERLEGLYAAADLLLTATRYEGFGLPVLEALARGVPVVCSDVPVLSEVAGDCAVFVDPPDPVVFAGAVRALLGDSARAAALAARGRERAAGFTWARSAERTVAVYERALTGRGPKRPARASR